LLLRVVLAASVVRFSRSAERDEAGRSPFGALPLARRLLEKAPTEKTPVEKASSRLAGRSVRVSEE
jgi:hypothetical protein